jgi:hypothetical protein
MSSGPGNTRKESIAASTQEGAKEDRTQEFSSVVPGSLLT